MDRNILVIAPHADDEAFGCGGTVAKWVDMGARAELVVMAVGMGVQDETRLIECAAASMVLGFKSATHLFPKKEARLDTVPMRKIVTKLDRIIHSDTYDYVFIPYPSHHKDHKITHEASIAALRLGAHYPTNVLMYEYTYPDYNISGGKFYVDISGTIDRKLKAIATYESWVREAPHPASLDAAMTVARMRGLAIQVDCAEMFHVVQMIGD